MIVNHKYLVREKVSILEKGKPLQEYVLMQESKTSYKFLLPHSILEQWMPKEEFEKQFEVIEDLDDNIRSYSYSELPGYKLWHETTFGNKKDDLVEKRSHKHCYKVSGKYVYCDSTEISIYYGGMKLDTIEFIY